MLVDFMLIGAQKCGTSSLANQLAAHPAICFSEIKEPGYFHQTADWQAGLDRYHSLYAPEPGQLCGEGSTFYTFFPEFTETHRRLYDYNPDLKLIYIMRQPVERIVSLYAHNVVRDLEKRPPEVAVLQEPSYINRSRYGVQIRPYLELFGPENVLLLIFEEYTTDQINTLERVAAFLGIDPAAFAAADTTPSHQSVGQPYLRSEVMRSVTRSKAFQTVRNVVPAAIRQPVRHRLFSNTLREKPEFSPELRQTLWRLLEDDVRTVEGILGRRLDGWRQGYQPE